MSPTGSVTDFQQTLAHVLTINNAESSVDKIFFSTNRWWLELSTIQTSHKCYCVSSAGNTL